jgi:hypothetical protein
MTITSTTDNLNSIVGVDVSLKFVSFVESIDVTFVRVEFSVVVPFDHVYVVTVEVADLLTIHFPFPPLPPLPLPSYLLVLLLD